MMPMKSVVFQYDNDMMVVVVMRVAIVVKMMVIVVVFQYDNVEGVTILLPADDQDISIQVT